MANPTVAVKKQTIPFAQIPYTVIEDKQLTWKTKGVLIYLLSRPDGWEIRMYDLIAQSVSEGKRAVQTAMAELVHHGYASLEAVRNEKNTHFIGKRYVVHDVATKTMAYSDNAVLCSSGIEIVSQRDCLTTAPNNKILSEKKILEETKKKKEENQDLWGSGDPLTPSGVHPAAARLLELSRNGNGVTETAQSHGPDPSPPPVPSPRTDKLTPDGLRAMYNTETPDGHPKVENFSPARRAVAAKAIKDFPDPDYWHRVFAAFHVSAFLQGKRNGQGHSRFKADYDWLFQKGKNGTIENHVKVEEGKYQDEEAAQDRNSPTHIAHMMRNIYQKEPSHVGVDPRTDDDLF